MMATKAQLELTIRSLRNRNKYLEEKLRAFRILRDRGYRIDPSTVARLRRESRENIERLERRAGA